MIPPLNNAVGVCLIAPDSAVTALNSVAREWLAQLPSIGGPHTPFTLLQGLPEVAAAVERVLAGESSAVVRLLGPSGRPGSAPTVVHLHRLDGNAGPQAVAIIHPALPNSVGTSDALTGLPDRRELAARAANWQREPHTGAFAVLFLDLDDFKHVNDQFGHAAGDHVLRELAARWLRCVREGDLVVRYGGDEFVILLKNVTQPADAAPVIERLHDVTEGAIELGDLPLRMTCTIGVALSPRDGENIEKLVAAADRDMYARKRHSRPTASR